MNWDDIKSIGSDHYKSGKIEPIDVYRHLNILRPFALANIIKYAWRNTDMDKPISNGDMNKIIHYAQMMIATCGDGLSLHENKREKGWTLKNS